jgi:hypothetical protein
MRVVIEKNLPSSYDADQSGIQSKMQEQGKRLELAQINQVLRRWSAGLPKKWEKGCVAFDATTPEKPMEPILDNYKETWLLPPFRSS